MILAYFIALLQLVYSQKIEGDVGVESPPSVPSNPFNIPNLNLDDILKNLPTLPPIQIPTLDPNFLNNLPTLPPLVFPTLDPNFWNNFPTISPIQLPTLDPNFWQKLVSLPPLVLPTIGPDFWKNLPTLPPLPTLDPNFWNNLPTLAPLPTLPPFVFPGLTPKTDQCLYKLAQETSNNSTFEQSLNYTNINQVVGLMLEKAQDICTGFQTQKLTDLSRKYGVLESDTQQIVQYLSTEELKSLLLNVLNNNSPAVFQFFLSKVLSNLANPEMTARLNKVSSQLSLLQFELAINPI